jgi:DNA-binding NarL/FixJ family response regulator
MADTIRIHVVLAEHADRQLVESALENEPSLEIVGYADYLEDWQALIEGPGDVVVVGCYGSDDGVKGMVDYAVKHRPDRPVVVMSEASPNGFLRGRTT